MLGGMPRPRIPVSGFVWQVRWRAQLSQRELAVIVGIEQSMLSRIEAERAVPTLPTFEALLQVAGLHLTVVDEEGRFCPPLAELPDTRDGADRRWPAHLGLILDPEPGEWWGSRFGLVRPPETFHRDPATRRRHRAAFTALRGIAGHNQPVTWEERYEREQARLRRWRERTARARRQRERVEQARRIRAWLAGDEEDAQPP